RVECMLPAQWMRLPPWWQERQAWLRVSGGVAAVFENMTSGLGRAPCAGLLMCDSLSPWQLVQVGVRASARVPCLLLAMASTGKLSFSSWQRVHLASPARTRSLAGAGLS